MENLWKEIKEKKRIENICGKERKEKEGVEILKKNLLIFFFSFPTQTYKVDVEEERDRKEKG